MQGRPAAHSDRITIVVPSFNRHPFLRRLLAYYVACRCSLPIFILDSSDVKVSDAELEQLLSLPKVAYLKFDSSTPFFTKVLGGMQTVTTPYTVLWADDDFQVPRALEACVNFLDANPDHSAAHGQAGLFETTSSKAGRAISWVGNYSQTSITGGKAAERLNAWLPSGSTVFYSVQRTDNLRVNLARRDQYGLDGVWGELVLGCMSVIQGKTAKLDRLYMIRECHTGQDSTNVADTFDWIMDAEFVDKYNKFSRCLSEALAQQDNISQDDAMEIVKKVFWCYLDKALNRDWHLKYASEAPAAKARNFLKTIPGSRAVYNYAYRLRPGTTMLLPALLSSRSPYHEDFMSIYRAVAGMVGNEGTAS